jgi:anti-sigma B factor antagonist
MTIQERASRGVMILDLDGRLTIETVPEARLADTVRSLLQAGRKQIVLNLACVPRVDTAGLCAIIEAFVTTRRQEGTLKLLNVSAHVREVLRVTRLLTIFEAYDSEADAVASFGVVVS